MRGRKSIVNTINQENLIVDIIYNHKGIDNCVTAQEIVDKLEENGFFIKARSLNTTITKIKMSRKLPICYKRGSGYFWATNKKELLVTINDLKSMVSALNEHIEMLESFIIE